MRRKTARVQRELRFGEHQRLWAALADPVREKVRALLREMLAAAFRHGLGVSSVERRENHP